MGRVDILEFFDLFVVFQYIVIPAQAGIYVNGVYY